MALLGVILPHLFLFRPSEILKYVIWVVGEEGGISRDKYHFNITFDRTMEDNQIASIELGALDDLVSLQYL